jgi:antitoxin component YwqK of YwqJK toxin-antitoxin module
MKEQNFNEGKLDGITNRWYQNGQKSAQQIFHNGRIVTAIGWKPDGSRCPSTRVINGAGVVVLYDDFGEEISKREKLGSPTDEAVKSVERYENGNIREEGYRINAKKEGLWIYYRPDGLEHFRIDYQEGVQKKMKFSSSILPK